ncbi:MAG: HNH endonuclease [Promethearchaeota archaeon]
MVFFESHTEDRIFFIVGIIVYVFIIIAGLGLLVINLIIGLIMIAYGSIGLYYVISNKNQLGDFERLYWFLIAPVGWFITLCVLLGITNFPEDMETSSTIMLICSTFWYLIPILILIFRKQLPKLLKKENWKKSKKQISEIKYFNELTLSIICGAISVILIILLIGIILHIVTANFTLELSNFIFWGLLYQIIFWGGILLLCLIILFRQKKKNKKLKSELEEEREQLQKLNNELEKKDQEKYKKIPQLSELINNYVNVQLKSIQKNIKKIPLEEIDSKVTKQLNLKINKFVEYLKSNNYLLTHRQIEFLKEDCYKASLPIRDELKTLKQAIIEEEQIHEEKEAHRKKIEQKVMLEKELFDAEYQKAIQKEVAFEERICPNCKKRVNEEAVYCEYCGVSIEKRSRYIPPHVKKKVWKRDRGQCVKCGKKENLEFDHIIPFSKGGSNTVNNIQLLCENCNRMKYSRIDF